MADYTIRKMTREDIERVVGIQEAVLQKKLTRSWRKALENYMAKDPRACLVAVKGKATMGFIIGDIKVWGFGMRRSGWIEILGVHPKYMGTGVGRALGRRLMSYFKREGVDGIHTNVRWDSGDLLSFFKSIGFENSGYLHLVYDTKNRKRSKRR